MCTSGKSRHNWHQFFGLLPVMISAALILSLALPQTAASAPETWTYTTQTLTTARRFHTATFLNGKVLAVGGVSLTSPYTYFDSVEIFDPAAGGTWETVAPIPTGRAYHTATLLDDGQVLVVGGVGVGVGGSVFLTSAKLYNLDTNTWTDTGDLIHEHVKHTATLLDTGKVLVVGGMRSFYYRPELYDPLEKTWAEAAPTAGRQYHTATRLKNGKVLVAGGNDNANSLKTAVLYNPADDSWTPVASLNHAREYHTATLLSNGKVLVAGGFDSSTGYLNSAEVYDPMENTWTDTGSLGEARQEHQAVMLDNGLVLVVGGMNDTIGLATAELYNPVAGKWRATGPLNTGRLWFTATKLNNGQVLSASGLGLPFGLKNTAELYDPPPPSANPAISLLLLSD